jgi:hypothetical protein
MVWHNILEGFLNTSASLLGIFLSHCYTQRAMRMAVEQSISFVEKEKVESLDDI